MSNFFRMAALVTVLAASPSNAAKQTEYSAKQFKAILEEAAELAHYKKLKVSEKIEVVDSIERLDDGRWRVFVTVYDYKEGSTQTVYILKYPVLVNNVGSSFEAAFLTPEVPAHLFDRALENDYWRKAREEYSKKHKDVRITYGREGNQLSIISSYSYAQGVKPNEVRDRLEQLFVNSSWVGRMALVATRLEEMELQKELYKSKPTHLSKAEVPLVLAMSLDEFEQEDEEAQEGYWAFSIRDRSQRIFNYGDRLAFAYACKIPDEASIVARAGVLVGMEEWVKKNKAKDATTTEAMWSPSNTHIYIKATYALDGKLKGEKLKESYSDFRNDFSAKAAKQIDKILEAAME